MNTRILQLGCGVLCSTMILAAGAEELKEKSYVSLRAAAGQINLEGPAVTGPGDLEGEDEDGFGLLIEVGRPLTDRVFLKGLFDWSAYDEFQLMQLSLGVGYRMPLTSGDNWNLSAYGLQSADYARTEGLSEYRENPDFGGLGTGEDGDDVGVGVEGGLTATWAEDWESELYAKYYNFGDGDGPGFGLRVHYQLNPDWTAAGSWEGVWVEDAGFNIDLAYQRVTLGLARTF